MKTWVKNMIRFAALVALLFILVLLAVETAKAQGPDPVATAICDIENYGPAGVDGSVVIKGVDLAEAGDSLLLVFRVEVNRRAINNRQTWRIVPQLESPLTGEFERFPTLLITGPQKDRHFKRKERFGNRWLTENYPDYKTSVPKGTDTVITYRVTVPYDKWMDDAQLNLYQYLASPKEKRQLFSSEGYAMVRPEPREPYRVQLTTNYIAPDKEVKKRSAGFYSLVDFPVNVSRIIPDFRRNSEELRRIDHQLKIIKDNPYLEIEAIFMEGHASPEGTVATNERLAFERVMALKRYFIENHGINEKIIEIRSVTEDWEGMRAMVRNWDANSGRDQILAIIDSPQTPNMKEQRLRALPTWDRLVMEVFPLLRRTEYRIDYQVRDFTLEQSRSLIQTHHELFSHYELYRLAVSYGDEPDKRLEVFENAVMLFPDDDIALCNYAAALIEAGEYPTAKRYLQRISDKTMAANNLGIVCLMDGYYQEAEEHFEASPTQESLRNLQELRLKMEDEIKLERYKNR